jgi:hypothetical protein
MEKTRRVDMHNTSELEYITVEEGAEATGYSLRTLKAKLRGRVSKIGKNYDRKEFFDFFRREYENCQSTLSAKTMARANQRINTIARTLGKRKIVTHRKCRA